jgi:hypothetical protein
MLTPKPNDAVLPPEAIKEQRSLDVVAETELAGPGLIAAITERVSQLQIDEQRAYIAKIAVLLSPSALGAAPAKKATPALKIKRKLFGPSRSTRQSARLRQLRSKFASSRRSQAAICAMLGIIDNADDFNDDTLLSYLQFFKDPIPPAGITKLAELAGVASPSQLRLPVDDLQAILDELTGAAA